MKSQYWTREEVMDFQLMKLRKLGIKSWEDFYSRPIMTKDDLPLNFVPVERNTIRVESSGSTGEPRAFYIPSEHWKRKEGVFMRNWKWMGWRMEPVLRLGPAVPKWPWYDQFRNVKVLDRKNITQTHLDWTLKHKPFIIHGRGGGIMETCMRTLKINPSALKNTRIFWCGEDSRLGKKTLKPFVHSFFEGYGLAELAPAAGSCRFGTLHINMDCGIVEVIKHKIIVTDLDNDVQPIIRYDSGDEGELRFSDCPCGLEWPILEKIKGRRTDYYDGPEVKRPIHWWIVGPLSHEYGKLLKAWKAEIYPKKGLFILYVVFRELEDLDSMEPYKQWVNRETGLDCVIIVKGSAKLWKRELVKVIV